MPSPLHLLQLLRLLLLLPDRMAAAVLIMATHHVMLVELMAAAAPRMAFVALQTVTVSSLTDASLDAHLLHHRLPYLLLLLSTTLSPAVPLQHQPRSPLSSPPQLQLLPLAPPAVPLPPMALVEQPMATQFVEIGH